MFGFISPNHWFDMPRSPPNVDSCTMLSPETQTKCAATLCSYLVSSSRSADYSRALHMFYKLLRMLFTVGNAEK